MKTIYKYPLQILDEQFITIPLEAKILCVQMQRGEPHIWASCDPTNQHHVRIIRIVGTGHTLPDGDYIGTIQQAGGALVWHVFDGGAWK